MSGEVLAAQGFPLALRRAQGERKAFFDGLLCDADRLGSSFVARGGVRRMRLVRKSIATRDDMQSVRDRQNWLLRGIAAALLLLYLASGATVARAQGCPGDCGGDGSVTVDEVLRALAIALGERELDWCAAADRDADGAVSVDEILFALQMALQGCPRRTFMHGMNIASWWTGQFAAPEAAAALDQLAATSIDTVVIVPTWYMESATSSEIIALPQKTSTFSELAVVLEEARARGFRTVLKPHVDPLDEIWRGLIEPEDLDAWFANYERLAVEMAVLANEAGCDMFVFATEFQSLSGAANLERWRRVIAAVRSRYGGAIAYAANWDGYADVGFWDLVDVVGVDAYFPLSDAADPATEEILAAWLGDGSDGEAGWMGELLDWYGQAFPAGDKRLVFTEVGYVASDFALRRPWEYEEDCFAASGGRAFNAELQARAYAAVMRATTGIDGIFWWHWEPYPVTDDDGVCRYTPQGKPAELLLRQAPNAAATLF